MTYLVYELEPEDEIDSMSLGMIVNNRIPGISHTIYTQVDNTKCIKCDVTARVPAEQYLLGMVNKKRLLGVFQGVVQAFLSVEDYMIDPHTLQLELGSIFADVATADTVMICVPVLGQSSVQEPDLRGFFKNILFNAQYDARENQDYVAKLMSYLNGSPAFSVPEFKKLLDYLAAEPVHPAAPVPVDTPSAPVPVAVHTAPVSSGTVPVSPGGAPVSSRAPSMPVPQKTDKPAETETSPQEQQDSISLFYLLQHYNKENAALYKAQKEAKKAQKAEERSRGKADKGKKTSAPGFEVPGQEPVPAAPEQWEPAPPPAPKVAAVPAPVQPAAPVPQAPPPVWTPQPPVQQIPKPVQVPQPIPQAAYPPASTGEETLYFPNDDEATVLLGQEPQAQHLFPHLVRKKNNERIPISKAVFRLGRDVDYNDYAIVDNRYVGHGHCHIVCRGGEFFVVDDNSKNHTKVKGEIITPGEEVKIAHGDIIFVADEEFEFKLY